jgi:hypothetical protein
VIVVVVFMRKRSGKGWGDRETRGENRACPILAALGKMRV